MNERINEWETNNQIHDLMANDIFSETRSDTLLQNRDFLRISTNLVSP